MSACGFRFDHYRHTLSRALEAGYEFRTCADYARRGPSDRLTCVLRHDVDESPERAMRFAAIEHDLGIPATYFFRIHANEYNPFSYEVLSLIRDVDRLGHEVGLHAEPLDAARATPLEAMESMRLCVAAMRLALGHDYAGVASHRDWTQDNNLDFFRAHPAPEFGLEYEAYDDDHLGLFARSSYLTDSAMWHWRLFVGGELTLDQSCWCEHVAARRPLMYVLTHPHAWYDEHYHRVRY